MSGDAVHGLIAGTHTLVVGVEDDSESGGVRIYLGHRALGAYAVVTDPDTATTIREAWARGSQHLTVLAPPPDRIFYDEPAAAQEEGR